MIYVRRPTSEEQVELQRMTRQEVGRVSQRAQLVLLSAQRRSVPEIARSSICGRSACASGCTGLIWPVPHGLYDAARSGRPRKVTAAVRDTLATLVTQDPARPEARPCSSCACACCQSSLGTYFPCHGTEECAVQRVDPLGSFVDFFS
jgi:hypothetical protein